MKKMYDLYAENVLESNRKPTSRKKYCKAFKQTTYKFKCRKVTQATRAKR